MKYYVVFCRICQQRKSDKRPKLGMLQPNTVINGIPFQDTCIVYVGPMIMSRGFKYIIFDVGTYIIVVQTCRRLKGVDLSFEFSFKSRFNEFCLLMLLILRI